MKAVVLFLTGIIHVHDLGDRIPAIRSIQDVRFPDVENNI
jgi:hypothetical protein